MSNPPDVSQKKNLNDPVSVNTPVEGKAEDRSELVAKSLIPEKSAVDFSDQEKAKYDASTNIRRDLILTHREAEAGSPDDIAVCGEEDTGAGLEFLVTPNVHDK